MMTLVLFGVVLFAATGDTIVSSQIWSPVMQGGFAAFAVLLFVFVVWLVRRLLDAFKDASATSRENGKIIQANTQAILGVGKTLDRQVIAAERQTEQQARTDEVLRNLAVQSADQIKLLNKLYETLLSRPCIAEREQSPA